MFPPSALSFMWDVFYFSKLELDFLSPLANLDFHFCPFLFNRTVQPHSLHFTSFEKDWDAIETERRRRRRGWPQLSLLEMFHRQKGKIKSLCPAFLRKSNSLPLEKEGKPHSIHRLVLLLLLALYSAVSVFRLANSPIIRHSESGIDCLLIFFYSQFSSFGLSIEFDWHFICKRFRDKDTFLESAQFASQKGEAESRLTPLFSSNQW